MSIKIQGQVLTNKPIDATPYCWRCGIQNPTEPPDLGSQVAGLAAIHANYPELFHLQQSELKNLLALLQRGDVLLVLSSHSQVISPMYGSILLRRAGRIVVIDRKELQ